MPSPKSPAKDLIHTIHTAAARYNVAIEIHLSHDPAPTQHSWPRTNDPTQITVSLLGWPMPPDFVGNPDDPNYDDSPAAHLERREREMNWRNDLAMKRDNDAGALISALRATGLTIYAGGEDPREVLVRDLGEVQVSYAN